jgi:hypothetical protein
MDSTTSSPSLATRLRGRVPRLQPTHTWLLPLSQHTHTAHLHVDAAANPRHGRRSPARLAVRRARLLTSRPLPAPLRAVACASATVRLRTHTWPDTVTRGHAFAQRRVSLGTPPPSWTAHGHDRALEHHTHMSMVEHSHYAGHRHGLNLVPLGRDATSTACAPRHALGRCRGTSAHAHSDRPYLT